MKRSSGRLAQRLGRSCKIDGPLMLSKCTREAGETLHKMRKQRPVPEVQCHLQSKEKPRVGRFVTAFLKIHVAKRHLLVRVGYVLRIECPQSLGGERACQFVTTFAERGHTSDVAPVTFEDLVPGVSRLCATRIETCPCLGVRGAQVMQVRNLDE